jgi:hypothetical protein
MAQATPAAGVRAGSAMALRTRVPRGNTAAVRCQFNHRGHIVGEIRVAKRWRAQHPDLFSSRGRQEIVQFSENEFRLRLAQPFCKALKRLGSRHEVNSNIAAKVIHAGARSYISSGINRLPSISKNYSSFQPPCLLPFNRETGRTYDVPVH